jgi:enoyl-CoA hydratase/carnithine racemase
MAAAGAGAVSDIAIASEDARFAMPEAFGTAPSFISPYVIQRVGLMRPRTHADQAALQRARGLRLRSGYRPVHRPLHDIIKQTVIQICKGGPNALAACKALIFEVLDKDLDATVDYRANLLDDLRRSEEAQEGMAAFIHKRSARWVLE